MKTPPDILPLTPTQGLEGSVRVPYTYFISPMWTEMGKSSSALPTVEKALNYSPSLSILSHPERGDAASCSRPAAGAADFGHLRSPVHTDTQVGTGP